MKAAVALVLSAALILRATPAAAAAPDLSEARRKFVAAVKSSDQAVASAEAALDAAIAEAGKLTHSDARRSLDSLKKILKALQDFTAGKQRILAGDLGSHEKLMRAAAEYARACEILGAVVRLEIAIVVAIVAVFAAVATGGTALVAVVAVVVAVAAVVSAVVTIVQSLPVLLRVLGFREAGDTYERWMKDNPWFGTTLMAIQVVAAVISTVAAAVVSLRAAEAAARDAQARLEAAAKAAPPPTTPPPPPARLGTGAMEAVNQVLTSFEGDLGGSFHVSLESGQATRTALSASLRGTVGISSKANPALKLTLEGQVTLTAGGGGWASLGGHGTARLSGFGPVLTIPNARTESQGVSSLALLGDPAPFRGCTHSVETGSVLAPPKATLAGSLRCGSWTMASSTLTLEGGGVSGGGTLTAWGKAFAMSYSVSGSAFAARGSLSGADTPWKRLPGIEAEFRIEGPKLDMKLDGQTLAPTFGAGKLSVRTTAKKRNGDPWSSASMTPGTIVVPAPPSDGIPIPFPNLPTPADAEKAARDACRAAANKVPEKNSRNAALAACDVSHPSPPGVPSLPPAITLKVGEVFP